MTRVKVSPWVGENGRNPFEEFFLDLEKEEQRRVLKLITKLEEYGRDLGMPNAKYLGDKLFELRERTFGFRIYYTYRGDTLVILLAGGNKGTQKRDIEIAKERMKLLVD